MRRRNFVKTLPLAAITGVFSQSASELFSPKHRAICPATDFDYEKAIVVDGIIIARHWNDQSFEALDQSGYTGFFASLDSGDLPHCLGSVAEWRHRIDTHPDRLIWAQSAEDFRRAKREEKTAVLLGFQNTSMIGNTIDKLNVLYQAGVRWLQLTYNSRNLLGDGCTERTNAGLSDFGVAAVERMNELGIIVDLSHCGPQTTDDGIQISKQGVAINHSMCEALHKNHPRAKTDAQIKAMADKGGVIGIISLGYMIGPSLGLETTLETYVDHIEHAINVGGIDHVGVAADFAIQGLQATGATKENWYEPRLTRFKPSYKVQWPPWIPELDSVNRFRHVTKVLDRRGYKTGEIEKILGLNWLRYFENTMKP